LSSKKFNKNEVSILESSKILLKYKKIKKLISKNDQKETREAAEALTILIKLIGKEVFKIN